MAFRQLTNEIMRVGHLGSISNQVANLPLGLLAVGTNKTMANTVSDCCGKVSRLLKLDRCADEAIAGLGLQC